MSKVWRRIQRVGKKAFKYRFSVYSFSVTLNCASSKWTPDKVCFLWTHRNRKHPSKLAIWEPTLGNSQDGKVEWDKTNDLIEFDVTLYKNMNEDKFEAKEWVLMIESEDSKGKRNLLASQTLDINEYVSIDPLHNQEIKDFKLKPISSKIKSAFVSFSLASKFLKEGKATDEDMVSLASYMSSASSLTASANPYFNRLSTGSTRPSSDNDSIGNDEVYYEQNEQSGFNFDFATTVTNNLENMDTYFNIDQNATLNNNIEFNFKNQRSSTTSYSKIIKHDEEEEEERSVPVIVKTPSNHKKNRSISTLDSSTTSASLNSTIRKIPSLTANDKLPNKPSSKMAPIAPPPQVTISPPSSSSFSTPNPFETEPDELNPFAEKDGQETPTTQSKSTSIDTQSTMSFLNNSETSRELLNWCRNILDKVNINLGVKSIFKNVTLNDFSTSWLNGLAFCAIIYHFRPDLIKLKHLHVHDHHKQNLKEAFNATDSEKIMRVVDYGDIINRKTIDQLQVITYLYQIRDHFENVHQTKSNAQSPQSVRSSDAYKSIQCNDSTSSSGMNPFEDAETSKSSNPFEDDDPAKVESDAKTTSPSKSHVNNNHHQHDNPDLDRSISSSSGKTNSKKHNISEDLIERAKHLMEKNKSKAPSPPSAAQNDDKKSEDLKQRAKELIQQTRRTSVGKSTPKKNSSLNDESSSSADASSPSPSSNKVKQTISVDLNRLVSLTNEEDQQQIGTEYINSEIALLKRKQQELDECGASLEKQIRTIMRKQSLLQAGGSDVQKSTNDQILEDTLLRRWFLLINEKNALLHRQQELEILQNEKSLEKRYEILSNQLRYLMNIDEFQKTDEQRRAEAILFSELISLVNKRNELVIQLDEENKLLNDGEAINEYIQNKSTFQEKQKIQCSIQ